MRAQTITTTSTPTEERTGYMVEVDEAQVGLDADAERLRLEADRRFGGDRDAQLVNKCQLVAEACGANPTTGLPYYTGTDVLGWLARAVEKGCEAPRLGPKQIERLARLELIPNALLRERYEELREKGEVTASSVARAIGVFKSADKSQPDATYVERLLGVAPTNEDDVLRMRLFIPYEKAVALAKALGMDYQDVGV